MKKLSVSDFLNATSDSVEVIIEPETDDNEDTPPREGRLGDAIFEPYENLENGAWPSPMPTTKLRLHSESYDCWEVVTAGAQGLVTPHRVRPVKVSDPYCRYRHGSSIDRWRAARRATLRSYGLSDQETELVVAHELCQSAAHERGFRSAILAARSIERQLEK